MQCTLCYHIVLLATLWWTAQTATLAQVEQLHIDLFTNYRNSLFPVLNQSDSVTLTTNVLIVSINEFDELSGELDLTAFFFLSWTEERLTWDPKAYGGQSSLLVDPGDIWRPQLFVLQSSNNLQDVGNTSLKPRVAANGLVIWSPGTVLQVTCSVDVTYFPFDTQTCNINIYGWSYNTGEVTINVQNSGIDTTYFSKNSQWDLLSDSTVQNITTESSPPGIVMELKLKRRSEFFVVYIIIPIIFLGLINNLVFVMPVQSGERMSVSVTTFLSFILYLEMINESIPESSSPMAYLYYYVLFLLVYSCTTIMLCLLSLRIYDKDEPVPEKVKVAVRILRGWCIKRKKRSGSSKVIPNRNENGLQIVDVEENFNQTNGTTDKGEIGHVMDCDKEQNTQEISWHLVGKTYDFYTSAVLGITFVAMTIDTFTRLYYNKGLGKVG